MFCTQCGTQTEPGTHFCKGCGAKVDPTAATSGSGSIANEADAPAKPIETSARRPQTMLILPTRERGGGKGKIVIAAVAVLVVAIAGIYFGAGLLTEPASKENPLVESPPSTSALAPASPAIEENKSGVEPSDSSQSSLFEPIPPDSAAPQAEISRPAPEAVPKAAPRADVQAEARRPQVKGAGQDAPASNRASRRSPAATPASRVAGVYQTLRSTAVFETPSASARVVANIPSGVRVNVVGSSGEWLEVHSRRGNPPGFIRRDDAQPVDGTQ